MADEINMGYPRSIRLNDELWREVDNIVYNSGGIYQTISHFVRCAVIKYIRAEIKDGKIRKHSGFKN